MCLLPRQYDATGQIVDSVIDAELCSEEEITAIQDSYSFATTQLEGYCEDVEIGRVCDVKQAQLECLQQQTWLAPGASNCR